MGLDAGISSAINGLVNFTFNTRKSKEGTEAATAAVGGLTKALRVAGTVAKTGGLLHCRRGGIRNVYVFRLVIRELGIWNELMAYLNIAASALIQTFGYLNDELSLLSLRAEKALLGIEKMLSFGRGSELSNKYRT